MKVAPWEPNLSKCFLMLYIVYIYIIYIYYIYIIYIYVYIGGVGACEWSKYPKISFSGGLIFRVLAPLTPLLTFEFGVDGLNCCPGPT